MSKTVFYDQNLIYDGKVSKSGKIVVTNYTTGKYKPITANKLLFSAITMLDGVVAAMKLTGTSDKHKTSSGLTVENLQDLLLEIAENHD